jgi:hypothetical protein
MESGDLFSWMRDWLMNKKESYIGWEWEAESFFADWK